MGGATRERESCPKSALRPHKGSPKSLHQWEDLDITNAASCCQPARTPRAHNLLVLVPRGWRLLPLLATKVVRIRGRPGGFWLRLLLRSSGECLGGLPKWRQAALLPGDDALGSWACSLANSPSKLEHLFGQHCEAPDLQEREAAWPPCVSRPHVERSTWRILLRHSHKPASWRPAYSAPASGLTDLKKKLALADAQCTNKCHATCTSFCSAAKSARCLRTSAFFSRRMVETG